MKRSIISVMVLAGLTVVGPLAAQEKQTNEETMLVAPPRLSLEPGAPANPSGVLNIANGYESTRSDDWVFNFHGIIQFPFTFTVAPREPRTKAPYQSDTVIHAPSFYPGSNPRQFAWTGAIPNPFLQVAMTYGSPAVKGSILLDRDRITDAFVTVDLTESVGQMIKVTIGNFRARYGIMGEHDLGRYGTPLFFELQQGAGETAQATFEFDDMAVVVEQGFGFPGVNPVSPTIASHLHAGFSYSHLLQLGLHYVDARSVSDTKTKKPVALPQVSFIGAEARLTAKQFGHLYLGAGKHSFNDISPGSEFAPLPGGYKVLNVEGAGLPVTGSEGFMGQFLGDSRKPGTTSNGNGGLLVAGGQYDLSIGNLLYPELEGYGPDILVSLFGMYTKTNSLEPAVDGKSQNKFGVEATYAMTSWFGAGIRTDVVNAYNPRAPAIQGSFAKGVRDVKFQMISPRAIFKSDWASNDQLVLQYTRVNYGQGTISNDSAGNPAIDRFQDENIITAYTGLWW